MNSRSLSLVGLLLLSACATEPGEDALFVDGEAASEELATELAFDLLTRDVAFAGVGELALQRVGVDDLGMAHVHVQQHIGGVPVLGGEAIVHLDPRGIVTGVTDRLHRDLQVDLRSAWSADEAIDLALAAHGPRSDLSAQPTATPWIITVDDQVRLTWRVAIRDIEDAAVPSMPVIFIDAHLGKVAFEYDDLQRYSLADGDKETYDMASRTRYSRARLGDSSDGELLETHDSVGETLAFLSAEQGRDSFDDRGAVVESYGHYSRSYVNAFWDGRQLTFGDGDGYYSTYLGVLDVTAHELGHAVTDYEADLIYSNESGALNEAASDMLAAAVEAWVDGSVTTDTWEVGEDCWIEPGTTALRYMHRPSDDGSSRDHYSDRYVGSSDNGGVHWNSGIANHWFHLLVEGGQHHDAAFRSGAVVDGVGIAAAYDIWYLALTSYMTSGTDFDGARSATESACTALGYGATVCDAVSTAWYEVGVGTDPSGGTDTGTPGGTDTGTPGGTDTGTPTGDTGTPTGDTGTPTGDTGTPTPGMECAGTLYTGTLSGSGAEAIEPDGAAAFFGSGLTATLAGPTDADFDLYLYSAKKRGWRNVDSSTSSSSDEFVSASGANTYYLLVKSYAGSGDYELCVE